MVRDTRAAKDAAATTGDPASTPNHKRKRRPSASPASIPPTLKVVLPPPNLLQNGSSTIIHLTPPNTNGDALPNGDHGPKKQRISLKLNANTNGSRRGESKSPQPEARTLEAIEEDKASVSEDQRDTGEAEQVVGSSKGRILGMETREALALVIAQMAEDLPRPLNGILTLHLPPDFVKEEKNTLGYLLRQDGLTWESLVGILHVFSENLLVPCAYPNPMPSLAQFHLPVPPLPSHYRPHVIYAFCAALHSILLQAEPGNRRAGVEGERWALMQKTVGTVQTPGGDWFTAVVDMGQAESALARLRKREGGEAKPESSLLEAYGASGDRFAYATPVVVQSALRSSSAAIPTISDTVIRRASLKIHRWKESRAAKRAGGFGSILQSVAVPTVTDYTFTPSFGPTYDSTLSSSGYCSTLSAMHQRRIHRQWSRRNLEQSQPAKTPGWQGILEVGDKGKRKETSESLLAENDRMIQELQGWQEERVRQGAARPISDREQQVADELLACLTRLAADLTPQDLWHKGLGDGSAHELAKRFMPVSSPSVRGILDPKRPQALHDNMTIRLRSQAAQAIGGPTSTSAPGPLSPHAPPPSRSMGYMPPPPPSPQQFAAPPPHMIPSAHRSLGPQVPPAQRSQPPSQPRTYGSPQAVQPPSAAQPHRLTSAYQPYQPNPNGSIASQIRTTSNVAPPVASYTRPGPGPSSLRQSFAPAPPSPFGPGGMRGPMGTIGQYSRPT